MLNFDSAIYVCADEDSQSFVDTSEMEIKRFNETTAILTGDITFMKEIREKTMVGIYMTATCLSREILIYYLIVGM